MEKQFSIKWQKQPEIHQMERQSFLDFIRIRIRFSFLLFCLRFVNKKWRTEHKCEQKDRLMTINSKVPMNHWNQFNLHMFFTHFSYSIWMDVFKVFLIYLFFSIKLLLWFAFFQQSNFKNSLQNEMNTLNCGIARFFYKYEPLDIIINYIF